MHVGLIGATQLGTTRLPAVYLDALMTNSGNYQCTDVEYYSPPAYVEIR